MAGLREPDEGEYKGLKYTVSTRPDGQAFGANFVVHRAAGMKGDIRVRLRESFDTELAASKGAHMLAKIEIDRIIRG